MGQENTIASRTTFEYLLQDGWVQVAACINVGENGGSSKAGGSKVGGNGTSSMAGGKKRVVSNNNSKEKK